jgi:hypothetical protein
MFVHLLVNWIVSENARWKQYKKKEWTDVNTYVLCIPKYKKKFIIDPWQ